MGNADDESIRRRFLPFGFAAGVALPLTFLPPDLPRIPELVTAGLLTLALAAAVHVAPWARLGPAARALPAYGYLPVIALLRHAEGGAVSGYGPLVVLPLFWVALHASRRHLWGVIGGIALVFVVPLLVFGAPDYPTTEWRRAAVWLAIAPIIGETVQRLVAEVRTANVSLAETARTDPLTTLPNRRAWEEVVTAAVARARRSGTTLTFAVLDLDRFKAYNDSRGHAAGDALLAGAAAAWRRNLRETDVLARWGGEEFVAMLEGAEPDARIVLERLRAAVPEGQTCSIGLAVWQGDEEPAVALARADAALYVAKESGRDRIVTAKPAAAAGAGG